MKINLLNVIDEMSLGFSKGQKRVAEYIKSNYNKAAFMRAYELANVTGVSESTVVRFATELGYSGYPEMQKAMQEMIRSKLTSVQRIELADSLIGNGDVLKNILNQDMENIKKTIEGVSQQEFNNVIDKIVKAKRIYIIGMRSSAALAQFLQFYFRLIFDNVILVDTTSESNIYEKILRINEEDVIIAISFPRYSKSVTKAIKFASNMKAKVIAVTDSRNSPLIEFSNHVLIARSDTTFFVDSLVAPLSLINALIVGTIFRKKGEVEDNLKKFEDIWAKYDIYEDLEERKS